MILPNFLVIGGVKSATTSIAEYLKQHPQIYISPIKEPFFFSFENEKLNFSGPGDDLSLRLTVTNFKAYKQLFTAASDRIAIGEASTSYLYTPKAAERIHQYIPNAKLIAILRNPIEQAYSSFLHQIREGYEPLNDFAEALKQEESRVQNNWMYFWHYKRNGFYYPKLKRYYDLFAREQIKVYLYSDFTKQPTAFIQNLFTFLGVDEKFVPDMSVRYNISGIPKSRIVHYLMTKSRLIKTYVKPLVPRAIRQSLRKVNLEKPQIPADIHHYLLTEYRQDILQLQDLIQRDLSIWLK